VVAAPIFQRIADDALRYLGVAPNVNPAPPVIVQPRRAQQAAAPHPIEPQVVPVTNTENGVVVLPDLRGYGAREAIHELARLGLTPRVRGSGVVVEQSPEPGAPLEPGTTCTIVLTRAPHPALVAGVPQ
jgi:cell division protein FtsI (penicillin-binding protein 3)